MTRRTWWRGGPRADLMVGALVVSVALVVGYRHAQANFVCQNCIPDLLSPCVGEFGREVIPAELERIPAYQAFWAEKRTTIPCEAVAGLPTMPLGQYWLVQEYMHAAQVAVMRFTGPRFEGFYLFLAAMYGLTTLAAYAVFRLVMGPLVAGAMTMPLVFSALHLRMMLVPADYAKAPFAIGVVFFLGLLIRRRASRSQVVLAALAAGATAGVGIGFKPDLIVVSIVALIVIALFVPPLADGGRWRRATAVAVFLAALLVSGGPILRVNFFSGLGSLFPVQMLGGMMRGHDDTHAAPSLYDYGINWDDSWVTFQINSYDQRVLGGEQFHNFQSPELTRAATRLLVAIDALFPADLILRVLGAVIRVLNLVPFGLVATAIVLTALFATRLRLALATTVMLAMLVGYVSLVFQPRHYFHLQFVPLFMIGAIIQHAYGWLRGWPARDEATAGAAPWRGLGVLVLLAVGVTGALWGARLYQQRAVIGTIERYDRDALFVPVSSEPVRLPDGRLQLVAGHQSFEQPPPTDPLALITTYLVVDVECTGTGVADVQRVYTSPSYWRHDFRVTCGAAGQPWRLFLPVYESGASWRFKAIEWSPVDPVRIVALHRVADTTKTPLLLTLTLPGGWRDQVFYHQFSWAALMTPQP